MQLHGCRGNFIICLYVCVDSWNDVWSGYENYGKLTNDY